MTTTPRTPLNCRICSDDNNQWWIEYDCPYTLKHARLDVSVTQSMSMEQFSREISFSLECAMRISHAAHVAGI